jgi:hypothetical protein
LRVEVDVINIQHGVLKKEGRFNNVLFKKWSALSLLKAGYKINTPATTSFA